MELGYLENTVGFLDVLHGDLWLEPHLCEGFRETDYCLHLSHRDWDVALASFLAVLRVLPVLHVQVLQFLSRFLVV